MDLKSLFAGIFTGSLASSLIILFTAPASGPAVRHSIKHSEWNRPGLKSSTNKSAMEDWVPKAVKKGQDSIAKRLPNLFEQLHLHDVVKEQVDTFSTDRMEAMLLTISGREFKLITYLGALIGGFVGCIQGIVVLWIV